MVALMLLRRCSSSPGATSASSKNTAPVVSTVTVIAFCCSGGVVCTVRGRLMWMALVSAGIVMTNATSSTSITSTSGVMLISLSTSLSSEVETAISVAPLDADRLQAVNFLRAAIGSQHRVLRKIQEIVGEVVVIGRHRLHATHE